MMLTNIKLNAVSKPCIVSRQVVTSRVPVLTRAGPETRDSYDDRPRRRAGEEKIELKHFLPLPKPKHLVYIKPTVAVVADVASRSSVGVKMTAGGNQLERYVVEYFARSVK
ncbi:hypothetical protein CEUSTIGMA_g10637.t1 [Chlamydomonas eustigma]|uniref:Uncharacterized protein n=1 Tax=Chlamydomonas eustigma TaxID=1157962 RepID=A0A250XJE6_9CHLO|nr:hypothetical protein CEUSTIGMA_g10637.t1 [Chlamydomonas eustigma]|eukprot:GAX83211.1 hypothetical protein CEUSTIGMA_g10637.t1 [Chlamydomonas eustigma]